MNTNQTLPDDKVISEKELHTSDLIGLEVQPDTELKIMLVDYVGTKFDQEEVTVNMIVETLAHEFPDFLYVVAEENFLRGYQTGLDDAYRTIEEAEQEKPEE